MQSAEQVIAAGATNLQSLSSDPSILRKILDAYGIAEDNALGVCHCVAVPFAACMELL